MAPRHHAPPATAAFTLVELMVVIALVGVLTAMIIPEMRGTYGDAALRAGGRDLASVCAIASGRAASLSRTHRVRLEHATGHYRLEQRLRGGGPVPRFAPVREVGCEGEWDHRLSVQLRRPGETVSAEPDPLEAGPPAGEPTADDFVTFYPDGTADRLEIHLRDRDGFGLALRVNPVTGRLRVVELPREGGAL